VTTKPFYFALEFSSQGASAELLGDLAAQVLEHVGLSTEAVPELAGSLQKAVAEGGAAGADRRCDVQFRVQPGKLEIVVSSNGGRVWQTTLPVS
jgi:hypothetical protein